jgi:hypothetical protein
VFEKRVLRRTFGPKRKEVTGEWRNLRKEELHILHFSTYVIRMVKTKRIRREEHTVLFSTPIASYKNKHQKKEEIKNVYAQRKKKQGNLYNLDNNENSVKCNQTNHYAVRKI